MNLQYPAVAAGPAMTRTCVAVAALCALLLGFWAPPADARVIHRERSMYSTIVVDQ